MVRVRIGASLLAACLAAAAVGARQAPQELVATATAPGAVAAWAARADRMLREGTLDLARVQDDTMVEGRVHERLTQHHHGIPVFGAELVRQIEDRRVVSVFGHIFDGLDISTTPAVEAADAAALAEATLGDLAAADAEPVLGVLPSTSGAARLAWRLVVRAPHDVRDVYVDAHTGDVVKSVSRFREQVESIGTGQGVFGDRKKVAATGGGGTFQALDRTRPAGVGTMDFRGSRSRLQVFLRTGVTVPSDVAVDSDNRWTDGAVVDAHVHSGWTYDYFFKRFGRRGMDDRNGEITTVVHPLWRADAGGVAPEERNLFINNALYLGDRQLLFGDGDGRRFDYVAAALDVVAHEWTHGVMEYGSNLVYEDEPGALNESFSDIMGATTEFFFQTPGSGRGQADWLIGEDVTLVPPGFIRSMASPTSAGQPDHYSLVRFVGEEFDNGGVHYNSGIPNHAFYLAVNGGTNRVSGITVQGIGAANIERLERVFYRAFVFYLAPRASFADARAATLQAAADLYGVASNERTQLERAWLAVGVP